MIEDNDTVVCALLFLMHLSEYQMKEFQGELLWTVLMDYATSESTQIKQS